MDLTTLSSLLHVQTTLDFEGPSPSQIPVSEAAYGEVPTVLTVPTVPTASTRAYTTITVPSPTTITANGNALLITAAPTTVILEVQPPEATGVAHDEVQTYSQYCFTATCCYLGTATLDPCLWDAAGVADFIASNAMGTSNWVTNLGLRYGLGQNLNCDITNNCNFPVKPADGTNVDDIKTVLALVAAQNWFQMQFRNYHTFYDSMNQWINQYLPGVWSGLSSTKSIDNSWGTISDGLSIAGALLGLIALPVGTVGSLTLGKLIAAGLGVAGGVGNLINSMPNPSGKITSQKDMQNYFQVLKNTWAYQITDTTTPFLQNTSYAVHVMTTESLGPTWLTISEAAKDSWNNPQAQVAKINTFLTALAATWVWRAFGIFLHWEPGCPQSARNNNYPAQSCLAWSDSQISVPEAWIFPVDFDSRAGLGAYGAPRTIRFYENANNWQGLSGDVSWYKVWVGSRRCQYYSHKTVGFPTSPYPQPDLDGLYTGDLEPLDIPCLYNLPICDAGDGKIVTNCTNYQRCCTGSGGHDNTAPVGGKYNSDNFGLDNWCAMTLGNNAFTPAAIGLNGC